MEGKGMGEQDVGQLLESYRLAYENSLQNRIEAPTDNVSLELRRWHCTLHRSRGCRVVCVCGSGVISLARHQ